MKSSNAKVAGEPLAVGDEVVIDDKGVAHKCKPGQKPEAKVAEAAKKAGVWVLVKPVKAKK